MLSHPVVLATLRAIACAPWITQSDPLEMLANISRAILGRRKAIFRRARFYRRDPRSLAGVYANRARRR